MHSIHYCFRLYCSNNPCFRHILIHFVDLPFSLPLYLSSGYSYGWFCLSNWLRRFLVESMDSARVWNPVHIWIYQFSCIYTTLIIKNCHFIHPNNRYLNICWKETLTLLSRMDEWSVQAAIPRTILNTFYRALNVDDDNNDIKSLRGLTENMLLHK